MEENCKGRDTEDGFCTLSEAVPAASDKTAWWRQVNGLILSEESQDLNDDDLRVLVSNIPQSLQMWYTYYRN